MGFRKSARTLNPHTHLVSLTTSHADAYSTRVAGLLLVFRGQGQGWGAHFLFSLNAALQIIMAARARRRAVGVGVPATVD
eukprot:scaffold8701_cov120-Isochrysis_galbana.AAC.9